MDEGGPSACAGQLPFAPNHVSPIAVRTSSDRKSFHHGWGVEQAEESRGIDEAIDEMAGGES